MREILEIAANAMVKTLREDMPIGACYWCEGDVANKLDKQEIRNMIIHTLSNEFPNYKFMYDGVDKIIVIEL